VWLPLLFVQAVFGHTTPDQSSLSLQRDHWEGGFVCGLLARVCLFKSFDAWVEEVDEQLARGASIMHGLLPQNTNNQGTTHQHPLSFLHIHTAFDDI